MNKTERGASLGDYVQGWRDLIARLQRRQILDPGMPKPVEPRKEWDYKPKAKR